MDLELIYLFSGVVVLLIIFTVIAKVLEATADNPKAAEVIKNLKLRVYSWWAMIAFFAFAVSVGEIGTVLLFSITSFLALREYISLTPTRTSDHMSLFWVIFIALPFQYILVATHFYGLFAIFIPIYGFIFIPIRSVIGDDPKNFLERTARIQWGLMVCIYFISHGPALLILDIPGYENQNAKLLMFFVLVVQGSDVLQYLWGKTLGKSKIVPTISPGKTWEGFIGGVASVTILGGLLWWATPFSFVRAALFALVLSILGFFGDITMSAIKRDIGVKDYGNLIPGHGGMLDRIDSLCFTAPVFFHLVRYFYVP